MYGRSTGYLLPRLPRDKESSLADYGIANLTASEGTQIEEIGRVSSEQVANQLKEISHTIGTVLDEEPPSGQVRLDTVEIALTVGAEGGVWFVAKGSIEASITLTFSRETPALANLRSVVAAGGNAPAS